MSLLRRQRALRRATAMALALGALALLAAACSGGGKKATGTPGASPTAAPTGLSSAATPPPQVNAGLLTPIAISPGDLLTRADLAARGVGTPSRGPFTGEKLLIPSIGVDAPFSVKTVGGDGQMPNPNGPTDVAWYDFSQWPKAGGLPGKGGNVVLAGHVDYIRYGPAVFWRLRDLKPGDLITIVMKDGTKYNYKVEFNKQISASDANLDFSQIVEATADQSVTLITCIGTFSGGEYDKRLIVWGRRV